MQGKNEQYYKAYLTYNRISRRALLRGVFHPAKQATQIREFRLAPRPPFAAAEDLFLAACNGCGACVAACPYNLIRISGQKAMLELEYAACDLCGKCAESCSTHALHPAFKKDTQLRPHFSEHCLLKQNQFCAVCQEICPQQAISADLQLNHEVCNGCGECKLACFVSAIQLI
ncbi:ferredoxin-type protein NapF [Basfia succiniciproducens]|uniref:Ferredoxin-type protein NapF n=1 Tax=Basfia succiniciproducens TaxID=653940 RepID=A0A1G5DMN2_9PAST|nr:ferredoxin-type protein NapF [Basfia succiniciproducens]QIM69458.1 ferredoxin-type protein NapF [Basfia succiniciproducens]SCY15680.1 ferredoxin-type protein NapF [Basfia succiniciproducens]